MSERDNAADADGEKMNATPSIEEAMGAVFDEMNAPEADDQPTDDIDKAKEADEKTDDEPKAASKDDAAVESDEKSTDQGEEGDSEPEKPAIDAPASWSAAAKSEWDKIPSIIRDEVLKREGDISKGLEQSASKLRTLEPLDTALEPVRQHLNLNGISPAQYLTQLVAAEQYLRQKPVEAIRWLMESNGIGLEALSQSQDQVQSDPAVAALRQQVGELTNFVQGQATTDLQREIEDFGKDPTHPYFEEVRQDMAKLVRSGSANNLQEAYDGAVWANPSTRKKLLDAQESDRRKQATEEAARRAKEAKRIAATNVGTEGASEGSTPKAETIEEEMAQVYDRLQGAA